MVGEVILGQFPALGVTIIAADSGTEFEDVSRGFSSPEKVTATMASFIPLVIFSVWPLLLV